MEVAHEALLREWPRLTEWIRTQREALIRRDEAIRDAARWDQRGRPDHLLPHPEILAEVRARLAAAGLWDELRQDARVAWFPAQDDPADLWDLTRREFDLCGEGGAAAAPPVLFGLTAPGRTWATTSALGDRIKGQDPALGAWLKAGLVEVLHLLGLDDAAVWHRRRLGIGDLMAALGDDRLGVGLRPDGLPDIDWVAVPPPGPYRIARYPITNAQYLAFTQAEDYASADWWREGYLGPEPLESNWLQPNRPRIQVAWVEALAFCRWLTARYWAAGLIGTGEVVRLSWCGAGRSGRERPRPGRPMGSRSMTWQAQLERAASRRQRRERRRL